MSDHNIERSLARAAKGNVTKFFSLKMISFEGDRSEFKFDIPVTCLNLLGTVQDGMVASILVKLHRLLSIFIRKTKCFLNLPTFIQLFIMH